MTSVTYYNNCLTHGAILSDPGMVRFINGWRVYLCSYGWCVRSWTAYALLRLSVMYLFIAYCT